jgi:hypothetical protein
MARTTASIALVTLDQVLRFAFRRGWALVNTVTLLEPAEKPRWQGKVRHPRRRRPGADARPRTRVPRTVHALAFTGLRMGEALWLCLRGVDFATGVLRGASPVDPVS